MNIENILENPKQALREFNQYLVGTLNYCAKKAEETELKILLHAQEHAPKRGYKTTLTHLVFNYVHTMEKELHDLYGDNLHLLEEESGPIRE